MPSIANVYADPSGLLWTGRLKGTEIIFFYSEHVLLLFPSQRHPSPTLFFFFKNVSF